MWEFLLIKNKTRVKDLHEMSPILVHHCMQLKLLNLPHDFLQSFPVKNNALVLQRRKVQISKRIFSKKNKTGHGESEGGQFKRVSCPGFVGKQK